MEAPRSTVSKVSRYCAVFLLVALMLASHASCRASPGYAEFSDNNDYCKTDDEINVLCQRCAKSTQSPLVFPMCCRNSEEAMDWCHRYVNFGIRAS